MFPPEGDNRTSIKENTGISNKKPKKKQNDLQNYELQYKLIVVAWAEWNMVEIDHLMKGGIIMSGISGISASSYSDYGKLASGQKIQSASDGAAGLSIIEKEDAQIKGYNAGSNNIKSGQELINVSDAALGGITDYLQRIRELALQASNSALMTDADRSGIQAEIDQMKQGIQDIANNTMYNTQNLLDGSKTDFDIAANSNGSQVTVSTTNATLQALGIEDFDVTGNFDLNAIDEAIANVSSARSSMGAQSNRLEHTLNYNSNAALNITAAKSRLEDLDFPKAISEQKKQETLQEYSLFMQKKKMEDETIKMRSMFM